MTTEQKVTRKLRAILSADVKGYSRLMSEDDTHTIKTLKEYRSIITTIVNDHSGRVVDAPGDNMLAEFSSVINAVQSSVDIQNALKEKNADLPDNKRLAFRIGVNIGDVVQDGDSLYGDGVNIAARIEGLADPGGVCISRNAYNHIHNKLNFGYEYLGEHSVKNIKNPVKVYKVLMEPEDAGKRIGEEQKSSLLKTLAWPAVIVASIMLISYLFIQKPAEPELEPASIEKMALPLPDKPSIAVLAFDNMSGDPEQEYFSDGIAEDIITTLSKSNSLFVVARNSTFRYKGKPVNIKQIAEELGVRYVLEGSVRKSEERVRITAQLIDAVAGDHLWAERYDRELKDIFALQDEITLKIVTALQVKLTEGEQARMWSKDNKNNLDIKLKGMEAKSAWNKGTVESQIRFGQLAQEILDMAPESSVGYNLLGWHYSFLALAGKSPQESIGKALKLVQKALSIDESDASSHALLGSVYLMMRQHQKAITEGKRSIELAPNAAHLYKSLGMTLSYAGRQDEAIGYLKKGIRINPFPDYNYFFNLSSCYVLKGQYENALTAIKKALHLSPDASVNHRLLAIVYALLDRKEEASAAVKKYLEIDPNFSVELAAKIWPFKNQADLKFILDALGKAGFPEEPPIQLPDKLSIAVLPFENMSNDPNQEYFSDGMTDELICDLAKIENILVISRNSTFTYKGKSTKAQEIAKDLNVRYILEGSVQKVGSKVRIRAQLIDGKTDHHIWSESYDGIMDDILELQDEITGKIVSALSIKLSADEETTLTEKGTHSIPAHDAYMKGMAHLRLYTPDDLVKAIKYFEEAVEIDPNYGQGYTALADAYVRNIVGGKKYWVRTNVSAQ